MESNNPLDGLFTHEGKLNQKAKKSIFIQVEKGLLEYFQLTKEKYKVFLKLFNKFSEGKPKKYSKEVKASIEYSKAKTKSVEPELLKELVKMFESESFNCFAVDEIKAQ